MKPTEFLREFDLDHAEPSNGGEEYNDEVGMAKTNIHTIIRVLTHLSKALESDENLPEWVQEKIAQVKGMSVDVMNYMISQHEQGHVFHNNESMMAGGMEPFSMESAERKFQELLGETTTAGSVATAPARSEEHTSELQSH